LERGDDDDGEDYDDDHERGEGSEELLEGIHSAFTYLTLMLVALHIFGVITSSLAHKENLVTAMVTGRKRPDD
jgi:cytochrome b